MVSLEHVVDVAGQERMEDSLAAEGKARLRHADSADETHLRALIERHLRFTGSTRALAILDSWEQSRKRFVKVFPNEYKRALGEMHAAAQATAAAAATASARAVA